MQSFLHNKSKFNQQRVTYIADLLYFCIIKGMNDMAEIAKRIYETSEGQILFISDFLDINDNEKVVSRALSVEEKKEI